MKTLPVKPKFRSRAKKMGKTQRRVPGDCAFPVQNFGDAIAGNVQLAREFRSADFQLLPLYG
jgi:hypothetical protein